MYFIFIYVGVFFSFNCTYLWIRFHWWYSYSLSLSSFDGLLFVTALTFCGALLPFLGYVGISCIPWLPIADA